MLGGKSTDLAPGLLGLTVKWDRQKVVINVINGMRKRYKMLQNVQQGL